MAFLLIAYVPFEPDEENKLVQEIRKLSAVPLQLLEEVQEGPAIEAGTDEAHDQQEGESPGDKSSCDDKAEDSTEKTTEVSDETPAAGSSDVQADEKAETQTEESDENKTEDSTSKDNDDVQNTPDNPEATAAPTADDSEAGAVKVDKLQEQAADKTDNDPEDETKEETKDETKDQTKEETKEETKETDGDEVTTETDPQSSSDEKQPADGSNTEVEGEEENSDRKHLTPLLSAQPLYKRVENALDDMDVDNWDVTMIANKSMLKFSLIQSDSMRCENILNKLKSLGVGQVAGTSISIFPASLHQSVEETVQAPEEAENMTEYIPSEEMLKQESQFKKSIKSRLVVDQVVASVRSNAMFTFDYMLLLILASLIACLGLVENSSVVLVASMLISPLMGPILAVTFGQVIKKQELRNLGIKSELAGLALCLLVGFIFGLISGGIGLHGAVWGSTDAWPTTEMKSRGLLRSLWVGVLIALPSGAGVAISVLGGNAGSLVGVAISASLLPPACNAGVLWAYALLSAISPPDVVNNHSFITTTMAPVTSTTSTTTMTLQNLTTSSLDSMTTAPPTTRPILPVPESCLPLANNAYRQVYNCNVAGDAALLGLFSLLLTILNITCILIMGILVLKIKEVAKGSPDSSVDHFWNEDVRVARTYYETSKGKESKTLGRQFLEEWKDFKKQEKRDQHAAEGRGAGQGASPGDEGSDGDTDSISGQVETINLVNYISDVENSRTIQHVLSKLSPASPPTPVAAGLSGVYNRATMDLELKLSQRPSVYLMEPELKDKVVANAYHTIHGTTSKEERQKKPTMGELRSRFSRPTQSAYFDSATLEMISEVDSGNKEAVGLVHPSSSGLWNRRKKGRGKKVKFQVTKVEEEALIEA